MFLKVFASGPADTNTYLVGCPRTREAALIDAPAESAPWILDQIAKHTLSIRMILLTHSHWDHTAEAAYLKEQLKAPLYVHPEDAANVEKPGSDGLPLFFPIPPTTADHFLTDGQLLTLGDLQIQVIHTPGHTPGGVCFYLPQEHILFSGDTLFQGTIGKLSFPTSSPSRMWSSLKRLATLPPETRVYPGHGDPTTIGDERWITHAETRFSH